MEPLEEQPDCRNFILFSPILNEEKRRQLVRTLEGLLSGLIQKPAIPLDSSDFERRIYQQLELLLSNSDLLDSCRQFSEVALDVATKFVRSIGDTIKKETRTTPFYEEGVKYSEFEEKSQNSFLKEFKSLESFLAERYSNEQINVPFYARAARELTEINKKLSNPKKKNEPNEISVPSKNNETNAPEALFKTVKTKQELLEKFQGFKQELMKDWGGNLERKQKDHLIAEIDKAREALCKELYAQIEKFRKMMQVLGPFTGELGRLWDLSKGNWQAMGFDVLTHYAALLEKQETLQKLAEMLGRLHSAEKELEEQEVEVEKIRYSQKIDHSQKSEIVSVHESDDLQYCLPQELAVMGTPETEILFYLKFAEKKLLTYKLINRASEEEHYTEKQPAWLPSKNKRGPIIICVDTSGSMYGPPETIAKTLCFALLRIALLENRNCYLISFSTAIETLELTDFNKNYSSLIQFLTHSFHGGTDATPALAEALRQIQTKKYEKADVLMISDFITDHVGQSTQTGIVAAKKTGTKFHSLAISSGANPSVLELFDNSWIYDVNNRAVLLEVTHQFRTSIN